MSTYNATANSTNYLPPGETFVDLFIERTNIIGAILGGVFYGIFITLVWTCLSLQLKGKPLRQVSWGVVSYVVILLAFATIYIGATAKWIEQMFIDYRNYPGGPLGFYAWYNTPMIIMGNAAYVVLNTMADGLVLYRCYLIWNFNWLVMFLPTCIFLASVALSIITVWNNSLPGANFFGTASANFAISWVSLSMALNIILTMMIVGRLLSARSKLISVLGKQHAKLYTSIAAMVVESAALYSGCSLLFVIFYAIKTWVAQFVNIILPILTMCMCIAPMLILVRVASGRAFNRDTAVATNTGMSINRPSQGGSTKVPMVSLNSKESRTQFDDDHTNSGWQHAKHVESTTSYV